MHRNSGGVQHSIQEDLTTKTFMFLRLMTSLILCGALLLNYLHTVMHSSTISICKNVLATDERGDSSTITWERSTSVDRSSDLLCIAGHVCPGTHLLFNAMHPEQSNQHDNQELGSVVWWRKDPNEPLPLIKTSRFCPWVLEVLIQRSVCLQARHSAR